MIGFGVGVGLRFCGVGLLLTVGVIAGDEVVDVGRFLCFIVWTFSKVLVSKSIFGVVVLCFRLICVFFVATVVPIDGENVGILLVLIVVEVGLGLCTF